MVFSSLIFIFAYLPITLAVYFLVPHRVRNLALFVLSLLFYGWGEPKYIALMLFSIISAYAFGFGIERTRDNRPLCRTLMLASLAVNLAALLFFKYANFFITNLSALIPSLELAPIEGLTLPVGISFYTFQIMSYTIDLYRGGVECARRFVPFGTYVTLFPQLIAGPIVRYSDVCDQLTDRRESVAMFAAGARRFVCGLSKKLLLGDSAAEVAEYFRTSAEFAPTAGGAWVMAIFYTFHIYFDFSGYSDMAIGLGMMFGFRFPENFNYPYIAQSVTDFWRRWHITLSTWFREYVYIPLGGNRKGKARQYLNLAVVWFLTGFWHGADWNYILWGVYFLVLLVLEKAFALRVYKKIPLLGRVLTTLSIVFGWVIFFFNDLSELLSVAKRMIGLGTSGGIGIESLRLIPFGIICALACTPIPRRMLDKCFEKYPATRAFSPVLVTAALILSISAMVSDTFSPFLYYIF